MEEALSIKQMMAAEDGLPQSSAVHDYLSKPSGTFALAIGKISAALRTILSETIALFSRISLSLQKVKRGTPQRSGIHDDLSKLSGTFELAIEKVRAQFRAILSEAIALFSRISSLLQNVKHEVPQSSAVREDLSKLSGTFELTIEKVRAAFRTILSGTIALFSGIYPSLQKVKRWLTAPMK